MSALTTQIEGRHYKSLAIQPTEYWKANHLNGDEAVIVKYVTRWRAKGGVTDLRKAKHHLQFILEDVDYHVRLRELMQAVKCGYHFNTIITPDDYIKANSLSWEEGGVVRHITLWNHSGARHELDSALKWMEELLAKALAEPMQTR